MHEVTTEIGIDAPAELVWAILTDFRTYARWNPFILAIVGRARAGRTVDITSRRQGEAASTSRRVLLRVTAPRELRWRGRWQLPGLFEREHRFRIDNRRDGGVRFRQIQSSSGLLARLMGVRSQSDTALDFGRMNQALKLRAEKAYGQALAAQAALRDA
jgi:hypothetical protein